MSTTLCVEHHLKSKGGRPHCGETVVSTGAWEANNARGVVAMQAASTAAASATAAATPPAPVAPTC
jgi:hypothetical protein